MSARAAFRACWIILLIGVGCTTTKKEDPAVAALREQRRVRLDYFQTQFATSVERAADEIVAQTDHPSVRRDVVLTKMRTIIGCRLAMSRRDPQVAYLNTWYYVAHAVEYLESPEAKRVYGDGQPIALAAAVEMEAVIAELGPLFLTQEQFEAAEDQLPVLLQKHALGESLQFSGTATTDLDKSTSNVLGKSLSIVRAPLESVDVAGLSDTAAAIHVATASVDQVGDVLKYAPQDVRWQAELLLAELSADPTFTSALGSFATMSDSVASLADTASRLPDEVRTELSQLLTDLDGKQAGLQTTLKEARATIEEVDASLKQVDGIMASTDDTAKALTEMGTVWEGTVNAFTDLMRELDKPSPDPMPTEEEGLPFDINDYGDTAEKLTGTAKALTETLVQLQNLTKPGETAAVLDAIDTTTRATIDHLTWRAGQLILFVFSMALGYRVLSARLTTKKA